MANTTYIISKVADGIGGTEFLPERVFKGSTKLTFVFDFTVGTHQVVKIKFGADGIKSRLFQGRMLPTSIEHTFHPAPYSYFKNVLATINIFYNNFESVDFLIPIKIAQSSFASNFENMHVAAAQFIDTDAAGDMFLTLNANGNIHHLSLLANESAQLVAPLNVETSILVATSATTTINPPIATNNNNLVEVVNQ